MRIFKSGDFGLLVCLAFIIVLFGTALYASKQQSSDPQPKTQSEREQGYQIEIKKERDFGETLSADPIAYYPRLLFIATLILAAFTFALAVVTVMIWKDGKEVAAKQSIAARRALMHSIRSVKASEQATTANNISSERQLRAYISIVEVTYDSLTCGGIGEFFAAYRNCGQTPAYDIQFWSMLIYLNKERRQGYAFAEPDLRIRGSMGECGPGIIHSLPRKGPRPLTSDEVAAIRSEEASIFFWGEIHYIDAFAKARTTCFRNEITGVMSNSGRMNVSLEGNTAT